MKQWEIHSGTGMLAVKLPNGKEAALYRESKKERDILRIKTAYAGAYGMGEKFNGLNQKGNTVVNQVIEHFCHQQDHTYLTAPFFVTDTGLGIYIATDKKTVFSFQETIECEIPSEAEIYVFAGAVDDVISGYMKLFGRAALPPKYAFGIWISANHWNCQKDVENQMRYLEEYQFPASVMVLEAWSDEATFYIWNGASYEPKPDGAAFSQEDFDYSTSRYWTDPADMIRQLHEKNIRLVLWQIPVYKGQPPQEEKNRQLVLDKEDAVRKGLCVKNMDGTPYQIPEGNWFETSLIPDFSNEETSRQWFAKRQYLLDMGVDGFKTDGGEFIYRPEVKLHNGMDGTEAKNAYARLYTEAYARFLGNRHVLFSRAGSRGAHRVPIHWGGDQQSENSELKGVFYAGMSAAMTGIPFWSFDIAGFAGPLPTPDLYRRATQFACFVPALQWHSEPDGGQFKEILPGAPGNNERSPWNIANAWGKPELLEEIRFWHNLHMKLLPYIYSSAADCCDQYRPMMRPLVYTWPRERQSVEWEDEYLFGESFLVAPLLEAEQTSRQLWLPPGVWYGFFTHRRYKGNAVISSEEYFPVYLRSGYAAAMKGRVREDGEKTGASRENGKEALHFVLAGERGSYRFRDEETEIFLSWEQKKVTMDRKGADRSITWEMIV